MVSALNSGETISLNDLSAANIPQPHELVESVLIVPIRYQKQSVGLISLHSSSASGFDASVVDVILSLAAQAAIGLGDAYSYEEQQFQEQLLQQKLRLMDRFLRPVPGDSNKPHCPRNPRRGSLWHSRGDSLPGDCDQCF